VVWAPRELLIGKKIESIGVGTRRGRIIRGAIPASGVGRPQSAVSGLPMG
jgi:hypothetical protein